MPVRLTLWLALLVAIICGQQASAFWQSRDSNYNTSIQAATTFQGPGDIASGAIAFWSAGRAYNAAYAAAQSPLADIVDTTTGLATCTYNVGANGFVNLTAVVCPTGAPVVNVVTFCTVTHVGCSITKIYDQTGTGNHVVQATLAKMPGLTLSAQNGLPCAAGTGSATVVLQTAGNITQSAPYSAGMVVERTGAFTTAQRAMANGSSPLRFGFAGTVNTVNITNGTSVNLTAADSAFHALFTVASGTAPLFAADSSANISTATNGTTALSVQQAFMNVTADNAGLTNGFACEGFIYPSDQNANYPAFLANMRSPTNGWNF